MGSLISRILRNLPFLFNSKFWAICPLWSVIPSRNVLGYRVSRHFKMITKTDLIKRNFYGIDVLSTLVKSVQFYHYYYYYFFLGGGGGGGNYHFAMTTYAIINFTDDYGQMNDWQINCHSTNFAKKKISQCPVSGYKRDVSWNEFLHKRKNKINNIETKSDEIFTRLWN